jgi:hypothetical protein
LIAVLLFLLKGAPYMDTTNNVQIVFFLNAVYLFWIVKDGNEKYRMHCKGYWISVSLSFAALSSLWYFWSYDPAKIFVNAFLGVLILCGGIRQTIVDIYRRVLKRRRKESLNYII